MAVYGKTCWDQKWLETFTGIDCDNRLPRGRSMQIIDVYMMLILQVFNYINNYLDNAKNVYRIHKKI